MILQGRVYCYDERLWSKKVDTWFCVMGVGMLVRMIVGMIVATAAVGMRVLIVAGTVRIVVMGVVPAVPMVLVVLVVLVVFATAAARPVGIVVVIPRHLGHLALAATTCVAATQTRPMACHHLPDTNLWATQT
jgi:hypothetical protein